MTDLDERDAESFSTGHGERPRAIFPVGKSCLLAPPALPKPRLPSSVSPLPARRRQHRPRQVLWRPARGLQDLRLCHRSPRIDRGVQSGSGDPSSRALSLSPARRPSQSSKPPRSSWRSGRPDHPMALVLIYSVFSSFKIAAQGWRVRPRQVIVGRRRRGQEKVYEEGRQGDCSLQRGRRHAEPRRGRRGRRGEVTPFPRAPHLQPWSSQA